MPSKTADYLQGEELMISMGGKIYGTTKRKFTKTWNKLIMFFWFVKPNQGGLPQNFMDLQR